MGVVKLLGENALEKVESALTQILEALLGTQVVNRLPDHVEEGTLTAASGAGGEVAVPVVQGMTMVVAWFHGIYSTATAVMECSFNSGTTWMPLTGGNVGTGGATTSPLSSTSNGTVGWEAAIPAGVTNIRAKCTALTSGTVEVKIAQGSSDYETAIGVIPSSLPSSSAVVGGVFSPGLWVDLSSTVLKANEATTPAAVDLAGVATAVAFTNVSTGVGEVRLSATSNVVGTLFLEESRDNVTFKKIKSAKLTQAEECEFYGEIVHRPSTRYLRASFKNGAAEQSYFALQMFRVGMA